jgi:carboxylesterase type B
VPLRKSSGISSGLATDASLACPQTNGGNWDEEGCLVANIATSWLPSPAEQDSKKGLRPIFVWLHGGGFISGSGLDPTFSGGNLASRSDVVVISANYRLGTLGWLAINDQVPGNYGLSDIITLLRWVRSNAAAFGGDPSRVTVAGQSSGAQLVQMLLRSSAAEGLFHRAIVQSGRPYDDANQRQDSAIAGDKRGKDIARQLGCDPESGGLLDCLQALPTNKFLKSGNVMSQPVVDGDLIDDAQLDVRSPADATGFVNRVPLMQGFMRDEMASLGPAPGMLDVTVDDALTAVGISKASRDIVESRPDAFPVPVLNNGVERLAFQVATDVLSISRCGQEASFHALASNLVFPHLYTYIFDSKSYQIDWDPNEVCSGDKDIAQLDRNYHCHSGDLLPVFGTLGFFMKPLRLGDLSWLRQISDQWMSFVRDGDPNPSKTYLGARGYDQPSGSQWDPMRPSAANMMSLGAEQRMVPLDQQGTQCALLKRPLKYIERQAR